MASYAGHADLVSALTLGKIARARLYPIPEVIPRPFAVFDVFAVFRDLAAPSAI